MKITTFETVTTHENLTNWKMWFNGRKKFSSVKVEPPQEEDKPPDLGVHVEDTVDSSDIFGRQ